MNTTTAKTPSTLQEHLDLVATYATLGDLLPLPAGQKFPPPGGYTGAAGGKPDTAQQTEWWDTYGGHCNYALRLSEYVLALDVDTYTTADGQSKSGAATISELELELGPLPPTWMSTRRGEPLTSGHRFYAYDGGHLGNLGGGVDTIQRAHRYCVVAPSSADITGPDGSVVPADYMWYTPDGDLTDQVPGIVDLAELPDAWLRYLQDRSSNYHRGAAGAADTEKLGTAMAGGAAKTCKKVDRTLAEWLERIELQTAGGGGRHDVMNQAIYALSGDCAQGHHGWAPALRELEGVWYEITGGGRGGEFERMVQTALSKRADEFGADWEEAHGDDHTCEKRPAITDPSTYAALGIVLDSDAGNAAPPAPPTDNDGEELPDGPDEDAWLDDLERDDKGRLLKSYDNTSAIMANDPVLRHRGRNTMGGGAGWRVLPPWRTGHKDPALRSDHTNHDGDDHFARERLRSYFGGEHTSLSQMACDEVLDRWSFMNSFSPWRDYLDALPAWDGVRRLERAIPTVEDTPYTQAVLANFFLGMAARAYDPGCKVDSMLVLVGGQGLHKTSWLTGIVPTMRMVTIAEEIPDATSQGKDRLEACHKSALVVFDEMDRFNRKHDQSALKAFITTQADTWRSPYGRNDKNLPRQFVMAGTTNKTEFLIDTTGNRRYWPVVVEADIPEEVRTREHMDLLLAEARDRYRAGERVRYDAEFEGWADNERAAHEDQELDVALDAWLQDPVTVGGLATGHAGRDGRPVTLIPHRGPVQATHMADIVARVPMLSGVDILRDKAMTARISDAMDAHPDFERRTSRRRFDDGVRPRVWWERVSGGDADDQG